MDRAMALLTLDCTDESAAPGVLHQHAEVGPPKHRGIAVDVGDRELDGGPGRPPDDGVEGQERADGDVRRQGDRQGAAEAEKAEDDQSHGPELPRRRHHLHSLRKIQPTTHGKKKLEACQ